MNIGLTGSARSSASLSEQFRLCVSSDSSLEASDKPCISRMEMLDIFYFLAQPSHWVGIRARIIS